jgi:hypothetical protein
MKDDWAGPRRSTQISTKANAITASSNAIAMVIWLWRLRWRWAIYFESSDAAAAGSLTTAGSVGPLVCAGAAGGALATT